MNHAIAGRVFQPGCHNAPDDYPIPDQLTIVDHPLVRHAVTLLRQSNLALATYREATRQLSLMLLYEAIRALPERKVPMQTMLSDRCLGFVAETETLAAVAILRAGLSLVDGLEALVPGVPVGYLGLQRDEQTAIASNYYAKLPPLENRHVLILDPMLATGGSALQALASIRDRSPQSVTLVTIISAPEGVDRVVATHPWVHIFTGMLDRCLNAQAFIVPGLGDFGDRWHGTDGTGGV